MDPNEIIRKILRTGILLGLTGGLFIGSPMGDLRADPSGSGATESEEQDVSHKDRIRAVLERFVASWNGHDAEGAALVYTDPHFDVNATPQEEALKTTVEKFRRYYAEFDTSISVTSDDIILLGDHAVQRGEFVLTSTPRKGGETEVVRRRYVEVLQKDRSGRWAVYWGIDGPLAGGASPGPDE